MDDEQLHGIVTKGRKAAQLAGSHEGGASENAAKTKTDQPRDVSCLEPVPGWTPPVAKPVPEAGHDGREDAGAALDFDEGEPSGVLRPEALVGSDDRIRIRDTAHFPWRPICALKITTTDGDTRFGTGWFIGPATIITAGHCLFLPSMGGWADSIEIVPGQDGNERPFGTLVATEFRTVRGWTDNLEQRFDYGAILLPPDQELAEVGHFGYAVYDKPSLLGAYLNIAGYPIDKPPGTLWWAARKTKRVERGTLHYDIDTTGGQSGAPVWRLDEQGRRLVVGIHTNGRRKGNSATRITDEVFANLQRWAAEPRESTQDQQSISRNYPPFP